MGKFTGKPYITIFDGKSPWVSGSNFPLNQSNDGKMVEKWVETFLEVDGKSLGSSWEMSRLPFPANVEYIYIYNIYCILYTIYIYIVTTCDKWKITEVREFSRNNNFSELMKSRALRDTTNTRIDHRHLRIKIKKSARYKRRWWFQWWFSKSGLKKIDWINTSWQTYDLLQRDPLEIRGF